MVLEIDMDPTIVNVLTDLILIAMQLIWLRAMYSVTASDLKRCLRRGNKIFSFEELGTWMYLSFGWAKWRKLEQEDALTGKERRSFRIRMLQAIIALAMSFSLVLLHVLIDYGLDFKTKQFPSANYASYNMTGIVPNVAPSRSFEMYEQLAVDLRGTMKKNCTRLGWGNNSQRCDREGRELLNFHAEKIRESLSFGRSIFESGSIEQLDNVSNIEFDYKTVTASTGELLEDCELVDFDGENTFSGQWDFDNPDCAFDQATVRQITLDMSAKILEQEIPTAVSPDLLGGESPPILRYHVTSKDSRQVPSVISLGRDAGFLLPGPRHRVLKTATLHVDNGFDYEKGNAQRIRLTDLSRKRTGQWGDSSFSYEMLPLRPTVESFQGQKDDGCYANSLLKDQEFLPMTLQLNGTFCGEYVMARSTGSCFRREVDIQVPEGGTEKYVVGSQSTRGAFLLYDGLETPEQRDCLARIREHYADFLDDSILPSHRAIAIAAQSDLICATRPGARKRFCQMGAKVATLHYDHWEISDSESDKRLPKFRVDTRVMAHAIEVEGGDATQVEEAIVKLDEILVSHYATLATFTGSATSRSRILGLRSQWLYHVLISLISTQIQSVQRSVSTFEPKQVAVLQETYVGGILSVFTVTGVGLLYAFARAIQERLAQRKIKSTAVVPMATTEWVMTALRKPEDLAQGTSKFCRYELTTLPKDHHEPEDIELGESSARCRSWRVKYKESGNLIMSVDTNPMRGDTRYT
ncbi:hypothetical protein NDN08_007394 [Rhodosorus marinus]|uniref:Uncharacterized protein n=1 Tax=Rhodosorus marinus TaxID=101924 RepID=A0AAV8UXF8_9RHOD|nr:hypothetical protein NDN08_007394 [Rhodosorus marinus]